MLFDQDLVDSRIGAAILLSGGTLNIHSPENFCICRKRTGNPNKSVQHDD
jgi:hypothetical protein